ncbi:MAG: TolC family protein [Cyclobacteriaceae bacterium]
MLIKRNIIAVLFLLAPLLGYTQQTDAYTLQECVDIALKNNLSIQRSQLNVENSKIDVNQSQFDRLPTVNGSIFNSYRWGRSIDPTTNLFTTQRINSNGFSANAQVFLFNGLQQLNTIKQNKAALEASAHDLESVKNDVTLNVVSAYLQVIFARELLENAKTRLNTTSIQRDRTKKLVDAGSLPITNLLELQSQEATNEAELISAENDLNLSMLQLKQLLQIPGSTSFEIEVPELEVDNLAVMNQRAEEVYQQAVLTMPEIKSADSRLLSSTYQLKVARGAHSPSIGLRGEVFSNYANTLDYDGRMVPNGETEVIPPRVIGYLESDPTQVVVTEPGITQGFDTVDGYPIFEQYRDNLSRSIGFFINIPIFNGFSTRNNIQRAKLQYEDAKIVKSETQNQLRQTIETAYNDMQAASKMYYSADRQVESLEESFRAIERSYNLGASNFVDYQVSSDNLFRAKSDLTRAKYDYIFKSKVIDFYLGNPITLD